jgi:mRNA-degrading endonuclease YafQ of YafQ-DinJ toxin-antitoxin module
MYHLEPTKQFNRGIKKLSANERRAVIVKLARLAQKPFHPSLRTKKLQRLKDVFECSVTMDIRILWMYEDSKIILLLDIGHHDIL